MTLAQFAAPVELVPGAADHVRDLARRLRPIDQLECRAMGHGAQAALEIGLANGAQTWTAMIDDQPHAMFGVVIADQTRSEGIPWFLGSDAVMRHARQLIAQGPMIVAQMHRHARYLSNFVSCDNRQGIRLLEHWGFTVEQTSVVSRSVLFRRFFREIN